MDDLDKAIAEKRRERDDAKAALERLAVELAMLEHAATLRPAITAIRVGRREPAPGNARASGRSSGRQPGSISADWQAVLRAMNATAQPHFYLSIADIAARNRINASPGSVRDRVRNFVKSGFLVGTPETGFTVTQAAIDRFGFQKETAERDLL